MGVETRGKFHVKPRVMPFSSTLLILPCGVQTHELNSVACTRHGLPALLASHVFLWDAFIKTNVAPHGKCLK